METTKPAAAKCDGSMAYNRAKGWQIVLFPFNNAATNVYFAFYNYFTYYAVMYLTGSTAAALAGAVASSALVLGVSTFTSIFVPAMRAFDGFIDPILGGFMDRTHSKFGKFRPYMIFGNAVLALSVLSMMVFFRNIPDSLSVLRWVIYIFTYLTFMIGYSSQCAVTKAGQTCLTNDPKQRSKFVLWNMVGMIGSIVLVAIIANGLLTIESVCPKGTIEYLVDGKTETLTAAAYGPAFYDIMVPIVTIISAFYTFLAVLAIKDKDKPEFWGVSKGRVRFKDYVKIIKENKEIRWLFISSGLNKLASTVATSVPVAFLIFGCMMGDYNGLYLPFYVACFVFMGLFFFFGAKTAGKKGQKRGVAQYTAFAILFYLGVLVLLLLFQDGNPATTLSLFKIDDGGNFAITINIYTILFIVFYGCGYGAFNCCDQMTIPMVADCTDYETYRSGQYVPGVMGTIFSLIDKVISSLQTLLLQIFIVFMVPGLNALPGEDTPYMAGMKLAAILSFCVLPMASWAVTLFCMTRYRLSGKKLEEIQAVNAVRKAAVEGGMPLEQAMATWQTIDQVPAEYVPIKKKQRNKETGEMTDEKEKPNFLDKIYDKIFTRREKITADEASSHAVPIPDEFVKGE